MRNEAQFFKDSLREYGVEVDNVVKNRNVDLSTDEFLINKSFGGDVLSVKTSLTDEVRALNNFNTQKVLAMLAEDVAKKINDHLFDDISVKNRRIEVSTYNGGEARCKICGAKVEPSIEHIPRLDKDAEITTPHPISRDIEERTSDLSGHERILLELYLIGELRRECDPKCPNSTERFN